MTEFIGTAGNDTADASKANLSGFTGGSLANLTDAIGDVIRGLDGIDHISGGGGNDTAYGGAGDDVISGSELDSLIGGVGNDLYVLGNTNVSVVENADEGFDRIQVKAFNYSLTAAPNVEKLELFNDVAGNFDGTGNDLNNDLSYWSATPDKASIHGGLGNDTLHSGAANDTFYGGVGNDTYDMVYYEPSPDFPSIPKGAGGSDSIVENPDEGTDTIIMRGPNGDEQVIFLAGNVENLNIIDAQAFLDIRANDQDNFISILTDPVAGFWEGDLQNIDNNLLSGFGGNDLLQGSEKGNNLMGGVGNDTLVGGVGNDTLDGGDGFDIASFAKVTTAVSVFLGNPVPQNTLSNGTDQFSSIEGLIGSTAGDLLFGSDVANRISGGGGQDALAGANGADTLYGGADGDIVVGGNDADSLSGGDGNDTIGGGINDGSDEQGLTNDRINGNAGDDSIEGNLGADTLVGGDGNDRLFADREISTEDGAANRLSGGIGNDLLQGAAGNDRLSGDAGNDTLDGGRGSDTVLAGAGDDLINDGATFDGHGLDYFDAGAGNDTIVMYYWDYGETALGGTGSDLLDFRNDTDATLGYGINLLTGIVSTPIGTMIASDFENVIGPQGSDSISGTLGNNRLEGQGGDDVINGRSGLDYLVGGIGNDTLAGSSGNDTIVGGNGSDVLTGGLGRDLLVGNGGVDVFAFGSVLEGGVTVADCDVIKDFGTSDIINLAMIDANPNIAGNQAFSFVDAGSAFTAAGQVRVVQSGINALAQINVDNDFTTFEMVIQLSNVVVGNINAGDFVL